ncbi:unnamed protein product [Prorocentrum cordatum]|uniref:Phospholipase B-like n=1 Tax=Prorocentrum cordatum TaxID=2364126 RepID=A0ABN9WFW9_9DINO|nr:unnamed protein product [Polarella glacialis]
MAPRRRELARHYDVPVVDYAAVVQGYNKAGPDGPDRFWPWTDPVLKPTRPGGPPTYTMLGTEWPNFVPKVEVTQVTCCPANHPPWVVHQYYADIVSASVLRMLRGFCSEGAAGEPGPPPPLPAPVGPKEELDRISGCLRPLTMYDARGSSASDGIEATGGWSLAEDVPGRPGWISTNVGATLSFRVRFGRSERALLSLGYLRSYEGVGTATVEAWSVASNGSASSRPRRKRELQALWAERVSLPATFVAFEGWDDPIHDLQSEADKAALLAKRRRGQDATYEAVVKFTHARGPKFKVLSVITC